ncbi:MAG TPA: hypothetical protein VMD59_15230 [Acidimicrobiales bacterium]|nr:hypothetical protein [Acidimicrobiales bacterium]
MLKSTVAAVNGGASRPLEELDCSATPPAAVVVAGLVETVAGAAVDEGGSDVVTLVELVVGGRVVGGRVVGGRVVVGGLVVVGGRVVVGGLVVVGNVVVGGCVVGGDVLGGNVVATSAVVGPAVDAGRIGRAGAVEVVTERPPMR